MLMERCLFNVCKILSKNGGKQELEHIQMPCRKKTNVLLLHLCVELKFLNLQLLAQTSFVFHSHIYVGDVYSFYQVSSMLLRCLSYKHELCLMVVNNHKSLRCNICSHNLQCIYILRWL